LNPRPLVQRAMPTRAIKDATDTRWRVFFFKLKAHLRPARVQTAIAALKKCGEIRRSNKFTADPVGEFSVDLKFEKGLKYGTVYSVIAAHTDFEAGEFDLSPAPSAEGPVEAPSGAGAAPADFKSDSTATDLGADPAAASAGADSAATSLGAQIEELLDVDPGPPPLHTLPLRLASLALQRKSDFTAGRGSAEVDTAIVLGEGNYGLVYPGTYRGQDVAVKVQRFCSAVLDEVAAFAAVGAHDNLVRLWDVQMGPSSTDDADLIFERMDMNLKDWTRGRCVADREICYVAAEMAGGLHHLHWRSILHGDLKPENVLVTGPGLPEMAGGAIPPERWPGLADWTSTVTVRICDLGSAMLAEPSHRGDSFARWVSAAVGEISTLPFRSPELLLRDPTFSYPSDLWSLGCVLAGLVLKGPLFQGRDEDAALVKILKYGGTPVDNPFSHLNKWKSLRAPQFPPPADPPSWLEGRPRLAEYLHACLRWDPADRRSAALLASMPVDDGPRMVPVMEGTGIFGPITVIHAVMDPLLLRFLQEDPIWEDVVGNIAKFSCAHRKTCTSQAERAKKCKAEEVGYVSWQKPATDVINQMDAKTESRSKRGMAFCRAMNVANKASLHQLTLNVQKKLSRLPQRLLRENGADFLTDDFATTNGAYCTIQAMLAAQRNDPRHRDGCASLPHTGVSVFGKRILHVFFPDEDGPKPKRRKAAVAPASPGGKAAAAPVSPGETRKSLAQFPGCVYMGPLATAEHQVEHLDPEAAEPLFHKKGDEGLRFHFFKI